MLIVPIRTRRLDSESDFANELKQTSFEKSDIVVVSSKAVATCEGAAIDLSRIQPSPAVAAFAKKTGQQPAFVEAVTREAARMNGKIVGTCPGAVLTLLRPTGMKGVLLCPNAGLDLSNVAPGWTVGWPKDPVASVRRLKQQLENHGRNQKKQMNQKSKKNGASSSSSDSSESSESFPLAVILCDSCCHAGRLGVTAFALCCAGLDPMRDERGKKDLFNNPLRITQEAVADQLATAANAVMGNAGQSAPAAVIRDHGLSFSDFCGWVDGIEPTDDIFRDVLVIRSAT